MLAARPFLKFDDDTTVLTEQFGECIWTVICFAQNNEKQFYLYQSSSCSLASSARSHISFSSRLKSPAFSSSSQFIPFSSSPVVEIFDPVAFDVVKFLSLLCTNRFYGSGLVSLCLCNAFPQGILGEFNLGRRILQLSLRLRQL